MLFIAFGADCRVARVRVRSRQIMKLEGHTQRKRRAASKEDMKEDVHCERVRDSVRWLSPFAEETRNQAKSKVKVVFDSAAAACGGS